MRRFFLLLISCLFLAILGLAVPKQTKAADTGTLSITLPPKEVIVPDQLKVSSETFTFDTTAEAFTPTTSGDFTVATVKEGEGRDAYYHITISGFKKGGGGFAYNPLLRAINLAAYNFTALAYAPPPASHIFLYKQPYGYKLTIKKPVSTTVIDSYASYQAGNGNTNTDHAFVGDGNCVPNSSGQFLCTKSIISFTSPELGETGPQYLLESFRLPTAGQVIFNGSVAAPGELSGFIFDNAAKAIAIGGTIPKNILNASKNVANYIDQTATKFSWTNIQGQLQDNFAKRTKGTTFSANSFSGAWNLNSNTNNPANSASSSFSTPPEGKLWNVDHSLTFSDKVTFNGSGTIAVNGNVTFTNDVICTNNTRLGIVASGTITFNSNIIGCGAYTALGGNITFTATTSTAQTARGIFVAKNSIDLPTVTPSGTLHINYDSYFGAHPTTLYDVILQAVFSTSS